MDELLDYSGEDQLRRASSNWMLNRRTGSITNLEAESSKLFLQYKNYHIHLVQKKDDCYSERPIVPALKIERLAYYRNYTATASKQQLICMQTPNFNYMIWLYLSNLFFKTLPHTYVHMFLASYAPDEHIFVPKMVPFFYGFKIAIIVSSFVEVLHQVLNCKWLLSILLHGLVQKNPWNRCIRNSTYSNITVNCYTLEEFHAKMNLTNVVSFQNFYYVTSDGEFFQLAQLTYLTDFITVPKPYLENYLYFIFLWTIIIVSLRSVKKRRFWKVVNRASLLAIFVELLAAVALYMSFDTEAVPKKPPIPKSEVGTLIENADVDMLSQSTTTPPVVHFLTARSTDEIVPNKDSAEIIFSNAVLYLFRYILTDKLNAHCNNLAGVTLQVDAFNIYNFFYVWPLFFSTFYLGDIFTLLYFSLILVLDISTMIVTIYCFVEIMKNEWKWLKQWMVTVLMVPPLCLFLEHFMKFQNFMLLCIYTKCFTTFIEVLAVFVFYPAGRLMDDITFHYGVRPTQMRMLSLQVMPIFYFIKCYIMIRNITLAVADIDKNTIEFILSWILAVAPFIVGFVVISYKYIVRDKLGWPRMFVPDNNWGPPDHKVRQLRKQYDSRYFIGSQVERHLSRYMIEKSEVKAYQLDLNYDPSRRSTIAASKFNMEFEKKNL